MVTSRSSGLLLKNGTWKICYSVWETETFPFCSIIFLNHRTSPESPSHSASSSVTNPPLNTGSHHDTCWTQVSLHSWESGSSSLIIITENCFYSISNKFPNELFINKANWFVFQPQPTRTAMFLCPLIYFIGHQFLKFMIFMKIICSCRQNRENDTTVWRIRRLLTQYDVI